MNILDVLSPLFRHKVYVLALFVAAFCSLYVLSTLITQTYKTTLFYTVIPSESPSFNNHSYATEGAERAAEVIAGWTKNPGFREKILDISGAPIDNFKRKITARKQNKLNLVITLQTADTESSYIPQLTTATQEVFASTLSSFNTANAVKFELQGPDVFTQSRLFPLSWILAGCFLLAFCFSILSIYLKELLADKVSFFFQLDHILGDHKMLRMDSSQDRALLTSFAASLTSPQFILQNIDAQYQALFTGTDLEKINPDKYTPVFVIQLGKTTMKEVQNLANTFGEKSAVIIFE